MLETKAKKTKENKLHISEPRPLKHLIYRMGIKADPTKFILTAFTFVRVKLVIYH